MSWTDIARVSETDKNEVAEQNSPDGVRDRLQRAALELFRERGYDRTTAAEIAARVGVTERTFFRYFPDKRETLFGGEAVLGPVLTEAVAGAPAGLGPLDLLFHAFRSVAPLLEANRAYSAPRQAVVSSTPALHDANWPSTRRSQTRSPRRCGCAGSEIRRPCSPREPA